VERLADPVSFLSQHRLFFRDDILPALVKLDDGVWRVGIQQRRQGEGKEMDLRDDLLRRDFYRASLDRMAAPHSRRNAAVLPAGTLGTGIHDDRRRTAVAIVRRDLLHYYRTAHVSRCHRRSLPGDRGVACE